MNSLPWLTTFHTYIIKNVEQKKWWAKRTWMPWHVIRFTRCCWIWSDVRRAVVHLSHWMAANDGYDVQVVLSTPPSLPSSSVYLAQFLFFFLQLFRVRYLSSSAPFIENVDDKNTQVISQSTRLMRFQPEKKRFISLSTQNTEQSGTFACNVASNIENRRCEVCAKNNCRFRLSVFRLGFLRQKIS